MIQIKNREQAKNTALNFLQKFVVEHDQRFKQKAKPSLSRNGCVSVSFEGGIISGSIPTQVRGGYVVHYRTIKEEIVITEVNYYPEREEELEQ